MLAGEPFRPLVATETRTEDEGGKNPPGVSRKRRFARGEQDPSHGNESSEQHRPVSYRPPAFSKRRVCEGQSARDSGSAQITEQRRVGLRCSFGEGSTNQLHHDITVHTLASERRRRWRQLGGCRRHRPLRNRDNGPSGRGRRRGTSCRHGVVVRRSLRHSIRTAVAPRLVAQDDTAVPLIGPRRPRVHLRIRQPLGNPRT